MKKAMIIAALVAAMSAGCSHEEHKEHGEASFQVTLPIKTDTLVYSEYVGQIRAIQHIELRALEEGYLDKIFVDEGQSVNNGQLVFQIKPTVYQAEVEKAAADAEYARIEYENVKLLADSNIVSKNELALAKAHYDKEKAELNLAKAHLGFTEIRAPFSGMIGRFNEIRKGSLLEEGELLTTLSDNSRMWVYFNVPESEYLNHLYQKESTGVMAVVRLKLANGEFFPEEGVIETIEADFNNETGNIAFRATFPNDARILRHGQTGRIHMPNSIQNALFVPQKATFEILDKKYVYVVKDGKLHASEIEIGYELPHLYEVRKGISLSDTILVEGLRKVKDGEHVETKFKNQYEILNELNKLFAE